jgi:hypothetical protein
MVSVARFRRPCAVAVDRIGMLYMADLDNHTLRLGRRVVPTSDYDVDGRSDPAIFRPETGTWYLLRSSTGGKAVPWGVAGDVPVPADYDGDGRTDVAVYRPNGHLVHRPQQYGDGRRDPVGRFG